MYIHDNGKTPAKAYKTTGLGLSNMRMRAKQIDADLVISTEDGYSIKISINKFP